MPHRYLPFCALIACSTADSDNNDDLAADVAENASAIVSLRNDADELGTNLASVEDNLSSLADDIDDLYGAVNGNSNSLSELNERLDGIESDQAELSATIDALTLEMPGIVQLGVRDASGCPDLGTTVDEDFTQVPNATNSTGITVLGTGDTLTAGTRADLAPGMYKATLTGTWSVSLNSNTIHTRLRLDCGGDVDHLHQEEVRLAHGVAGSSNVQTADPFAVTAWFQVADSSTITCALQSRVESLASGGSGILFHNACGPMTASLERVHLAE